MWLVIVVCEPPPPLPSLLFGTTRPERSGMTKSLTPDEKNWMDVVAELRRQAVERFNARRDLEWKLSLTLWGGLVLVANALSNLEQLSTSAGPSATR